MILRKCYGFLLTAFIGAICMSGRSPEKEILPSLKDNFPVFCLFPTIGQDTLFLGQTGERMPPGCFLNLAPGVADTPMWQR